MKYKSYTDEDIIREFPECTSITDLLRRLGLKQAGGSHAILKRKCDRLGLDYKSKLNRGWNKGKKIKAQNRTPNEVVFVENSTYLASSTQLKKRAMSLGYVTNVCKICGQGPVWNGLPMVLIMDHIDGRKDNNTPTNLRMVCPNCNSQLPTHAGRNAKKY